MLRILSVLLVFILSACAFPNSDVANISITLGYPGVKKDISEVAVFVETSDLKIEEIDGHCSLYLSVPGRSCPYQTLWNGSLWLNARIYTHLLPGEHKLKVRSVQGRYVGLADVTVNVAAGDVLSFKATSVVPTGILTNRGTFSVYVEDASSSKERAVKDFNGFAK
jgi:hypothetical protein